MAAYPDSIPVWSTKRNYIDIVWAEHMNRIQEEIQATQTTLGTVPQIASANPGGLKPDYGTVANRIQSVARGEQTPFFRGSQRNFQITPNAWSRPSLRADDDPFSMYAGTGVKLNEDGLWSVTIKADWQATSDTTAHEAARMIRLEVNGADIGVRNLIKEGSHNRLALHNHVTWEDTFSKGTVLSLSVRTNHDGPVSQLNVHTYLRAHLVRCNSVSGDGGSIPFEPWPDQPPGEKPPTTVSRPPADVLQYTVYCRYGGLSASGTGSGWTLIDIQIVDNSSAMFDKSTNPKFATLAEVIAFKKTLWTQLTGQPRNWSNSDFNVEGGNRWPFI
jgi:hypothetical protein